VRGSSLSENHQKTENSSISRWDFFKVFFASFFLQAVWNFRSLISIGFSVCLFPILDKLDFTTEKKKQFLQRHLEFFNAHPYFASYALGVSIKLEEMAINGQISNPEVLGKLKSLLSGPLGAIGDRLFWATIKPACLIFGMLGIFLFPTIKLKLLILLITSLLYNIPHLYFRYHGIVEGYRYGTEVYNYIRQDRFEKLRKMYLFFLVFSIFAFIFAYFSRFVLKDYSFIFVFLFTTIYAYIFTKLVNNFYLVCFSTISFIIFVGILFF
jgi:PTS system mannose-specific IID component